MANELKTEASWWYGNLSIRDKNHSEQKHTSLAELIPISFLVYPNEAFKFFDDFVTQPSTKAAQSGHWAVTEDDGATGTDAVQEADNGVYRHYCDGDDEDEAYVHFNLEQFILKANKHLFWEARVKLTESATNKANFIVGLSEAVGANHLLDAGAGPPADYDGMCWNKLDSVMSLNFETSLATAQVTSSALATHTSGTWYRLGAWCFPNSATTFLVYPFHQIGTANGVLGTPHALALGGGEMEPFFGVKAGSTAEEYIEIDYFWVVSQR